MAVFIPILLVLILLVSFLVTLKLTPIVSKQLVKVGITGRDVHKKDRPVLAEMGGISIVAGVVFGLSVAIAFYEGVISLAILFGALTCMLIIAIVGIVDDIFQLPQVVKAFLPMLAALPLMAIRAGVDTVSIPFFGHVEFGILYPLLLIPIGITGAANATNMLAGINGLEAGLGIVMHSVIFIASILILPFQPEAIYAAIISVAVLGSLVAFFLYNRYPSRTFPGDVGTLMIGGSLGAAVILGNMEKIGIILIFPYFIEFGLKAVKRFKAPSFGVLQKDGTLKAPEKISSLTHVAMRLGKMKEWQVFLALICMEIFFGILALTSVWLTFFR
jgi:UDP-N-acetylglucosamine--dolichyl-phosphate N-acetylglucosaminephosphotransferase